mmetsp:Transcript_5384/g.22227  ORF Transcript_5384/g.22227 Transcript_5384/m.22227 type:complete len:347 (+) Transcript_5384:915-1955(+)
MHVGREERDGSRPGARREGLAHRLHRRFRGDRVGAEQRAVEHRVEEAAGGGLAAFEKPRPRDHRVSVGSPDARREDGAPRRRGRHVTRRGARDDGEPPRRRVVAAVGRAHAARADAGEASGVRVDRPDRDRDAFGQSEVGRRSRGDGAAPIARCGEGVPEVRRRERLDVVDVVGVGKERDVAQEVAAPPRRGAVDASVVEVPLADERAERARRRGGRERARRARGEVVAEVEEVRRTEPVGALAASQPEQLGHLHLGRHGAADQPQHFVPRRRDLRRLGGGAAVHPHDDVALVRAVVVVVDDAPDEETGVGAEADGRVGEAADAWPSWDHYSRSSRGVPRTRWLAL